MTADPFTIRRLSCRHRGGFWQNLRVDICPRKDDTVGAEWAAAVWPTLPRRSEYSRWLTEAVNTQAQP